MDTKTYRVKQHRILADGTVKEYYCNKKYKVKNGVDDKRKLNKGVKEKLSPTQKEQAWVMYTNDVKMKRICTEVGASYITVKKCIDKRKAQNLLNTNNTLQ